MKKQILMLAVFLTPICGVVASEDVSDADRALYELTQEVAIEEQLRKSKAHNREAPPEVEKYIKGENGFQLYRDEKIKGVSEKDQFEYSLRKIGIVDTARAFGSQAALHWRYQEINKIIDRYSGRLDAVNFRPFMTDGLILTPSILITKNNQDFINDRKMVETNISFVVHQEARIVSVPPNFRDYLVREYEKPTPVNAILRPKNDIELKMWKEALAEGWKIGVEEAFNIFMDGLLRMERDFEGRINYRKMVQLKMISPAALKVTNSGVTFNGRTMNVGETIYEIKDNAQYKTMDEWRTAWLKAEQGVK